ncbi:MAG: thiamine phosphate synthase [Acidobacteriota bacterium]|nr:thiamine phosphate synthase [Acidobacteriota bacterium]
MKRIDWTFYLVADTAFRRGRDFLQAIEDAVEGGVTAIQIRGKNIEGGDLFTLASTAASLLEPHGIPLIINDRADVARACSAAGVHLGRDDLPIEAARKILGPDAVIGLSVNTIDEAREAERLGADYVGLGPVFATTTKDTPLPVLGPEGVARVKAAVGIPVIAIGGLNAANVAAIMQAGADGAAVISAVWGAPDVRTAAQEFLAAIRTSQP